MVQTALTQARALERPSMAEMLQRAPSVQRFWNDNERLFKDAWTEWETVEKDSDLILDSTIFDPRLRSAIEQTWKDPSQESTVRSLWEEVFPGVYKTQFFDVEKLSVLRRYMDTVAQADIPLRAPYGISLNRGGAMLDPRSEGYLAAPNFQHFYAELMNRYMRPVSRLLFPDIVGFDTQTFGFSIQWSADTADRSLRPHSDASSVTLNINFNLPDEAFSGSAVSFIDGETRRVEKLTFEPGTALIHHGRVPHASEPITEGQRSNFVFWLYGDRMQIPHESTPYTEVDAHTRWSESTSAPDNHAPF